MNEITKTILFLLIDSCLVAVVMEAIKKAFGQKIDNSWKTKLSRVAIIVIAVVLSSVVAGLTYLGGVLVGNWWIVILYSAIVFVAQWGIDMGVVKKVVDTVINKVMNRV